MTEQTEKWNAAERKSHPVFTGVLKYFPDALLEVAELSKIGNDQHNPGEPLHWARGKSNDQGDALVRHQLDVGTRDSDGVRHATKVAWRALAQLQLEIEGDINALGIMSSYPINIKSEEFFNAAQAQNDQTVWGPTSEVSRPGKYYPVTEQEIGQQQRSAAEWAASNSYNSGYANEIIPAVRQPRLK